MTLFKKSPAKYCVTNLFLGEKKTFTVAQLYKNFGDRAADLLRGELQNYRLERVAG